MSAFSAIWDGVKSTYAGSKGLREAVGKFGAAGRFTPSAEKLKTISKWGMFNIAASTVIPLFTGHTLGEKLRGAAGGAILGVTTAGMSPGRQMLAITASQSAPAMLRRIGGWHNSYLDQRTMAAIPFSYTPAAMDHAAVSMQYAMARMNDGYSRTSNEAAFFAARYTQR